MPRLKKSKYYVRPDGLHEAIRVIKGKRVAFRGRTDAEVERKMLAYKGEVERGRLFKDVAADWKEFHYKTLSPTTAHGYEASYKRAVGALGERPIKEIKPAEVDAQMQALKAKHYGKKTVSTMLLVLNQIFRKAVIDGEIEINPCAAVSVPKGLDQQPRAFPSDRDIEAVKKGKDIPGGLLPYFILYSGCRRGEAIALTYGDIDRENKEIHITKSVYFEHNQPKKKLPKTRAGVRDIILLDRLADALPKGKPEELLFPGPDGNYINEAKLRRDWKKWQQAAGTNVTAHQLRHGYATMLFEAGIDEKDAQELLGHASIMMTKDVYTSIRQKRKAKTAKKLNKAAEKF
jgi:integrase